MNTNANVTGLSFTVYFLSFLLCKYLRVIEREIEISVAYIVYTVYIYNVGRDKEL